MRLLSATLVLLINAIILIQANEQEQNEEDIAQQCISRNIDCRFIQPLSLYGLESSLSSGKSLEEICRELRHGADCMKELLTSDCTEYLHEKDRTESSKEEPIIESLCDSNFKEAEENVHCLKSVLTEENLNSCSAQDDSTSCDVSGYVGCLMENYSQDCPEETRKLFEAFLGDVALLKRECGDQ